MTTFKNFKIKGWTASIQNYAFNYTRFENLLYKALELCFFQLHPNGGSLTKLPTAKKLKELEVKINQLAQFGFHNSKTMPLALQMSEALGGQAIGFDALPIREWALHGKQILNSNELKESQIIAFSVLTEIDETLSSLSDLSKLDLHSIERVIGISLAIQSAYEIEYDCYNPSTMNSDATIQAYIEEHKAAQQRIISLREQLTLQDKMLADLKDKPSKIAAKGGKGKAAKVEKCKTEFLRMVDEHTPAWNKTKEGLAEAVLDLKPTIVKYAREQQNSVITASTNLPKKWLEEHWNLEKRTYKKTASKQN